MKGYSLDLFTSEFGSDVRGGAGIHVNQLYAALFGQGSIKVEHLPVVETPAHAVKIGTSSTNLSDETHLIHSHSPSAHVFAMHSGRDYVSTVHSLEIDRPWRSNRFGRRTHDEWVAAEAAALQTARHVVCVSDAISARLASAYGVKNTSVIPPGYFLGEMYHDQKVDALPVSVVALEKPFVLLAGRISVQKGYSFFFRALRHVKRPLVVVLRAGSPETADALQVFQDELRSIPNRHKILWLQEPLSRRAMRQLYSRASLYISPAIYEPFGLANVEALLCHCPVIATDVGGTAQALKGTNAILIPNPNSDGDSVVESLTSLLEDAWQDGRLRNAVSSSSTRSVLSRSDWDSTLPLLLDVYRKNGGFLEV